MINFQLMNTHLIYQSRRFAFRTQTFQAVLQLDLNAAVGSVALLTGPQLHSPLHAQVVLVQLEITVQTEAGRPVGRRQGI